MTMAATEQFIGYADLLTTTPCPQGARCERCGVLDRRKREHVVLAIVSADPVGVFCLTLCTACAALPALLAVPSRPAISPRTLPKLINQHSAHLNLAVSVNTGLTRKELQL